MKCNSISEKIDALGETIDSQVVALSETHVHSQPFAKNCSLKNVMISQVDKLKSMAKDQSPIANLKPIDLTIALMKGMIISKDDKLKSMAKDESPTTNLKPVFPTIALMKGTIISQETIDLIKRTLMS